MFTSLIIFTLALHSLLNFSHHHVPITENVCFFYYTCPWWVFELQCWESVLFLPCHLPLGPHHRHEPECKPWRCGSWECNPDGVVSTKGMLYPSMDCAGLCRAVRPPAMCIFSKNEQKKVHRNTVMLLRPVFLRKWLWCPGASPCQSQVQLRYDSGQGAVLRCPGSSWATRLGTDFCGSRVATKLAQLLCWAACAQRTGPQKSIPCGFSPAAQDCCSSLISRVCLLHH